MGEVPLYLTLQGTGACDWDTTGGVVESSHHLSVLRWIKARARTRMYRGTSLMKTSTLLGPYRRPMPRFLGGVLAGWAFSDGRGTPLRRSSQSHNRTFSTASFRSRDAKLVGPSEMACCVFQGRNRRNDFRQTFTCGHAWIPHNQHRRLYRGTSLIKKRPPP